MRWLLVLALGCSSPVGQRAPVPRAVEVLPDVVFADLDHEQRTQWMKQHVLPTMMPLFLPPEIRTFAARRSAT